jgi:hypothetical protein
VGNASPVEIDLGAEKLMSAERGSEKIVVEVKSFLNRSLTYDWGLRTIQILQTGHIKNRP